MTIKINGNGFNTIGPIDRIKKNDKSQKSDKSSAVNVDRVQFSSVIAESMSARETSAASESGRAEKLQSLKEQIADGSYSPDSTKVATSLLKFLAGNASEK